MEGAYQSKLDQETIENNDKAVRASAGSLSEVNRLAKEQAYKAPREMGYVPGPMPKSS